MCDLAIEKPVVYVGEELLQGKIILLPVVRNYFSGCVHKIFTDFDLHREENTSVTSLWVVSNLTSALQQQLVYMPYSTLLYRPNSELLPVLQQALWKLCQYELQSDNHGQSIG